MSTRSARFCGVSCVVVIAALATSSACHKAAPPPKAPEPAWQLLASELPAALLSVSARSAHDVFVVGADKGDGPMVLHFDGTKWAELRTGQHGDLWWVQALPGGPTLFGGAGGMVLRYDGKTFERMPTPGLAKQTVFGVWGTRGDDFYAVGNAGGRNGFVWHYHDHAFHSERLPADLPLTASGEVPGLFKVFGMGDEVWVVGANGAILHRKGAAAFTTVPSGTKATIFTVHGSGDHLLAVGGSGNGLVLQENGGVFRDASPPASGLLQGVFSTPAHGEWTSGERGAIYTRATPSAPFAAVDHGLQLPPQSSLHSITVDDGGGVWSAGGNVLTTALDDGMLVHYGLPVPEVVIDDEDDDDEAGYVDANTPVSCPADIVAAGKNGSIARRWDEQALAAIRIDLPRSTVSARNLYHLSAAMWDAWSAYDAKAAGVFLREKAKADDVTAARAKAVSYAAYDLLVHRYAHAVGGARTVACLNAVMADLGLDPKDAHDKGDDPIALGNRVGHAVIAASADDGSNEGASYADPSPPPSTNGALLEDSAGTTLKDPARWQPIHLSVAVASNGLSLPPGVQRFSDSAWGSVRPFAMKRGSPGAPWHDPGPAPKPTEPEMKRWLVEVIAMTAMVDPTDPTTVDTSPAASGHEALGSNEGKGWGTNPVTHQPYASQLVPRSDVARVMAEYWADGPGSETPPGQWNVLANGVSDTPGFERKLFGRGDPLDPLSWDVHLYLALNGALHDAAIAAWDIKRRDMSARAISLVRWMGGKGQSSDPRLPSYDPQGLPLVPGLVELVTKESSAPGERHEALSPFVGQVALEDWLGEPGDRKAQRSGVGWVRAVEWAPYQRRTFVAPPYPSFVSAHSAFGRSAAEVLAGITGSPYFPGGLFEYVAHKDAFLTSERGPSVDVHLQWASYADAADQAGQSRLYGGVQLRPGDVAGRRIGHLVGLEAMGLAAKFFDGSAPGKP